MRALPAPLPPAIVALPPTDDWVNVHTLGVKGDGQTDDTDAIQKAIDTHRVLYFPSGFYIVRNTIVLKPDTVLIALHPGTTQLDLPDSTPGYQGVGAPKPLLEAPQGRHQHRERPRHLHRRHQSARHGHSLDGGRALAPGRRAVSRRRRHLSAGRGQIRVLQLRSRRQVRSPAGRWGAQYPSLWVTHGGGGTFANIWTPNTFAQSGFYVSDTTTPGHVYELSAEHHLFNEIKLDRVENWDFNAPQTEEEAPTSPEAVSLEINWSRNITIANYHGYRVTRSHAPFPAAVRLSNSSDIRFRNVHVNAESGYGICDDNGCGTFLRVSKFPYENAIQDVTHHLEVREREFAVLDIPANPPAPAPSDASAVVAARRQRRTTRGRLLRDFRRRRRRRGHALFRRSPSAPDLLLVAGPTASTSCATIRWIP